MILAHISTRRERVHVATKDLGYAISINGYCKSIDSVMISGRYYEWTVPGRRHELWTARREEEKQA